MSVCASANCAVEAHTGETDERSHPELAAPLLVHRVLDHAARWHGEADVVSRRVEGPIHRETYRDLDRRSRRLASAASRELNVKEG